MVAVEGFDGHPGSGQNSVRALLFKTNQNDRLMQEILGFL